MPEIPPSIISRRQGKSGKYIVMTIAKCETITIKRRNLRQWKLASGEGNWRIYNINMQMTPGDCVMTDKGSAGAAILLD
jgi:hypothetical protein